MNKTEYELVVCPGQLPMAFIILAAIFYTAMLYFIYDAVLVFYEYGLGNGSVRFAAYSSEIAIICLVLGIRFSMTKDVLIDVDTSLLISRFRVGPISRDVHRKCPDLEYIAVFRNVKDMIEVNLWYKGNRHYKMYEFEDTATALAFAHAANEKLKLDLLDATVRGNSKWIDKP